MNNSIDHSSFFSILEGIESKDYISIDLSDNSSLFSMNQLNDPHKMADKIDVILKEKQKKIAYGGYLEKRTIYKKSSLFQSDDEERNIHLGVDFWAKKGTKVKCPEKGVIHNLSSIKITLHRSLINSEI